LILALATSSPASAQIPSLDISACLPPVADAETDKEDCSLTYKPPPPLRQDVLVSDCALLPGKSTTQDRSFRLLQCSVVNDAEEAVQSFRYGVRYFGPDDDLPLAEGGFEETLRFSTGNIAGNLQPGEQRTMDFTGPDIPVGTNTFTLEIAIEVLGVYAPGSRRLR
jgi:hypothetical protein